MRFKVVLVEDDPETMEKIKSEIDWSQLDCEIVGEATDGRGGIHAALEMQPDILISSIRMPEKTGLELMEAIRPMLPDCKIILTSRHARFQFARKAIKLGVFDYLLKPLNTDELYLSLRRAVSMTRRTQTALADLKQVDTLKRQAQLLSLLTNDSQRGQGVNEMLAGVQLDFGAYYIMLVQLVGERDYSQDTLNQLDSIFSRKHARSISILLYDSLVVFIMRDRVDPLWHKEAAELAKAVMEEMQMPVHVSSSQLHTSRHGIRQAYYQARQALWEIALSKQEQGLAFYQETVSGRAPSERVAETHRRINELIEEADLSDAFATQAAHVLVELSGHQYSNLRAMIALYTMALQKKYAVSPDRKADAALYNTWFVSSEADARECLLKLNAALRESHEMPNYSLLVRNAVQYINLHAIEGPQLNDVADKLCVSANYLSALMRKETGSTFHEQVLEAKMAVARSMLADPRITVEEVARAVGYGNYISFYNAFKRVEKMTPTEFRNRKAEE